MFKRLYDECDRILENYETERNSFGFNSSTAIIAEDSSFRLDFYKKTSFINREASTIHLHYETEDEEKSIRMHAMLYDGELFPYVLEFFDEEECPEKDPKLLFEHCYFDYLEVEY